MTCIIGLVEDGKMYLGSDSRRSRGVAIETAPMPKVFRFAERMLIGTAGDALVSNLIRYRLDPPKPPQVDESGEGYLFCAIAVPLQRLAKEHDFDFSHSEALIAFDGHLFRLGPDFSVTWLSEGMAAVGVGEEWAVGAMMAMGGLLPASDRIRRALEIAAQCCDGVAPPYHIEVLE